ncbi:MAG: outer membrane beta-barrel protein [candidate division WOR-3 bacterium]
MKKTILTIILLTAVCFAQCLSGPISTRVGIKAGFNPGTYEPGDNLGNMKGTGMHFGLGMGTDIFNLIALDMGAQFRTTSYGREEPLGRVTHSYNNLYFPIFLSIKAGMLPLISPYLGAGIGINVQFEGRRKWEPNGVAVETELAGGTNAYVILGLGAEIKLTKFRVCPEFTANIKPTSEDQDDKYTDLHFSVGLFYAP